MILPAELFGVMLYAVPPLRELIPMLLTRESVRVLSELPETRSVSLEMPVPAGSESGFTRSSTFPVGFVNEKEPSEPVVTVLL